MQQNCVGDYIILSRLHWDYIKFAHVCKLKYRSRDRLLNVT